jgi:phosphatidylglycerophosphate synthase
MAAVSLGDAGDGRGVRWAAERRGEETTPEGARDDERTDKEAARKILSAMAIRAFMNRDIKFGAFLTASLALIMGRDTLVTYKRDEAQALDIDIKATGMGKAKTGIQNLAFTTQTNPIARTKYGRKAVYLLQATADVLSVVSGVKTYRRLNKAIKEAKSKRASTR